MACVVGLTCMFGGPVQHGGGPVQHGGAVMYHRPDLNNGPVLFDRPQLHDFG